METGTSRYQIFKPRKELQPFIRAFAIQESIDDSTYQVLPDTNLVIGFQYNGSISRIIENKEMPLTAFGITGILNSLTSFKSNTHTGSVLAFFTEGGAAAFFDQPLHEISDESISLEYLKPTHELKLIQEQLQEAKTDIARVSIIEKYFLSRIRTTETDRLITAAIGLIRSSGGNIRISDLCRQLHTSKSPLEKRFRHIVGTSPKKFSSLVRFKSVLSLSKTDISLTDVAHRAGYYDQAHFIKNFRTYTGSTPEIFFAARKQ